MLQGVFFGGGEVRDVLIRQSHNGDMRNTLLGALGRLQDSLLDTLTHFRGHLPWDRDQKQLIDTYRLQDQCRRKVYGRYETLQKIEGLALPGVTALRDLLAHAFVHPQRRPIQG